MRSSLIIVAAAAGLFSTAVSAQGYFGAVRSLTNVGYNCPSGLTCDKSSKGWRFYAGAKLDAKNTIDFGIGKIEAVEVGYMKFGKTTITGATQPVTEYFFELDDGVQDPNVTRNAPLNRKGEAEAVTFALVARVPVVDQFSIAARLGAAYVSSTLRTELDGLAQKSETKTKFKPYIGLGFEYDIPSIVKLVGTLDVTRFDVAGYSGTMRMIGLGAEKSF